MKRWLFLILMAGLWHAGPAKAQIHVADSLQALLQAEPRADTTRVRRLQALSSALMLAAPLQSATVLKQALKLSRRLHDAVGEGQALVRLGTLCRRQADYEQARRYTQQAQNLFMQRHDSVGLAKIFLQWSLIEAEQENPAASLRAALQGLPYAERTGNRVDAARLQVAIGSVYVQLGNYQDAVKVLLPALRSAEASGDKHALATALNLLGNAYQQLHDRPRAVGYFNRSMRLNRQLNDVISALIDEINLSILYVEEGRLREALFHASRARAEAISNKDAYNLPPAELAMARVYLLQGRTDSAMALARHAFALSQSSRSNESLRNGSDILAQAFAQRGDFANAYHYQRLWVAYKDSVTGEETQKKTSALRYGYELDKKQSQIILLKQRQQLQAQQAARQHQKMLGLLAGVLGLVLLAALLARNVFLKQRANRTLNVKNAQIAHHRDQLDSTLTKLKATQSQLVQSEKMVALAALTAGVAHEIQNPLNFVNNFSEVSLELVTELEEERQQPARDEKLENELFGDLKKNLHKIHQHGSRAGDIVKGMLEHAHADTGQRQPVDLNAMAQDYLRLAYHGLQSKHQNVSVARTFKLDPDLGPLQLVPQEIGRVLLNLFTNAFYAVQHKMAALGPAYAPEVQVSTRRQGGDVELRVRDNGTGIPAMVVDKIFEPFFTTKPTGEGTGLGLWLSYDIITKGYGGKLSVHTQEGEYTEFVVRIPCDIKAKVPAEDYKKVAQD
ncbi:ATP-binding protein [Hymenobacter terricola]|uniref:ATP-binding protein n=1 Tax=Hymenobacter terricola TaxID=2819236 RepID=UPI001B3166B4|nr:ATP-binding protein [Hymenobacter terricola]